MRACVIFNPVARGNKARQFRAHLQEIGREATLRETHAPGDATRLAASAVEAGFDTIVAAGGDGTLNEVLNGLAATPGGLERARLGLLPLGTVNVFARELGLPRQPLAAWRTVLGGNEARVDVPCAEWATAEGPQRRWFCQMGGAGLDARAIERVDWNWKKRVGPLAYVWAGLKALRPPRPVIEARSGSETARGELVLLGNGRLYGGDYSVFPRASLADGRLEVCVFPRTSAGTLLCAAPSLLLRQRVPERLVRRFSAERVTLTCAERAGFELDGEWVGELPATFSVLRGALRVLTP